MCDSIVINGGNVSIQISGGGASVQDIQSGLATSAALAALATSVAGREQAVSVNAPNHIAVTADMSSATWNTVGTHEVFTVTGVVRMRMWVRCTENLTGDGAISIGAQDALTWGLGEGALLTEVVSGTLLSIVGHPPLAARQDVTTAIVDKVVYDLDVGYGIATDPATDGTLIFHCVWEPLSAGAMVLPGAGGPL